MTEAAFQVRFWGVRGSIPVSGPEYIRYGGNSPCIEMRCGNKRIVLDGGSGLRPCGGHPAEPACEGLVAWAPGPHPPRSSSFFDNLRSSL